MHNHTLRQLILLLLLPALLLGCSSGYRGEKSIDIPLYSGPTTGADVLPPAFYPHAWTKGDGSQLLMYKGETMSAWRSAANRLSDSPYATDDRFLRFAIATDVTGAKSIKLKVNFSTVTLTDGCYAFTDDSFVPGEWQSVTKTGAESKGAPILFEINFDEALAICRLEGETKEEKQKINTYREQYRYRSVPIYDLYESYPASYSNATCEQLSLTVYVTLLADLGNRILNAEAELELFYYTPMTLPGSTDPLSWSVVEPYARYDVQYTLYEYSLITP
jgi:hypothetical protein